MPDYILHVIRTHKANIWCFCLFISVGVVSDYMPVLAPPLVRCQVVCCVSKVLPSVE